MLNIKTYPNPGNKPGVISQDIFCQGIMLEFHEPTNTGCYPAKFRYKGSDSIERIVTTSPVIRLLKKLTNPKTGGGYYEFLTQGKDGLHRYCIHDWRGE